MFIIVCYDIVSDRRRQRIAKWLEGHGVRVQESVFECHLDKARLTRLKARMARLIDPETDRVRYYHLCDKDRADVMFDGIGEPPTDIEQYVV